MLAGTKRSQCTNGMYSAFCSKVLVSTFDCSVLRVEHQRASATRFRGPAAVIWTATLPFSLWKSSKESSFAVTRVSDLGLTPTMGMIFTCPNDG